MPAPPSLGRSQGDRGSAGRSGAPAPDRCVAGLAAVQNSALKPQGRSHTAHGVVTTCSCLRIGRQRQKLTATSTAQWDRNLSPLKVSTKREFLRFWPETFGRFSLELSFFGV